MWMLWAMWSVWGVAGAGELVPLNEATVEQLASFDEVDATLALRIVGLRTARGRLSSVEELRALEISEPALHELRMGTSVTVEMPEHTARAYPNPEAVLAEFAHEPTIQQVHAWANHYAESSPRRVRRWLRQSVSFAALPQVQLEYQLRNDWDQGFDYLNAEGTGLLPSDEPFPVRSDADQGQAQSYRVRLVWDLDELVMSSERIRVINEAQDIVKLRERVLGEATRLYFERRRLQVEGLLAPRADMMSRVQEELRILEFTAGLDALTGGAFSGATPTR